jgi:hypothetical protein
MFHYWEGKMDQKIQQGIYEMTHKSIQQNE